MGGNVTIHGVDDTNTRPNGGGVKWIPVKVDPNGNLNMSLEAIATGLWPSGKTYTKTLYQATAAAIASPTATYSVALDGLDMEMATVVLVTGSGTGTVNVEAQVSFDGTTTPAPSTPVTLFSTVAASGTYIVGLKALLSDGTNPIYGHYMTGDIDVVTATIDIDLYLMAQGK